jgi:hypothetical protein
VSIAEPPPRSRPQVGLILGWTIADLFYLGRPGVPKAGNEAEGKAPTDLESASEQRPIEVCGASLSRASALASDLGVSKAAEAWSSVQSNLEALLPTSPAGLTGKDGESEATVADGTDDDWRRHLETAHLDISIALQAEEQLLFVAYDVGRSLRKTCQLPQNDKAMAAQFEDWRIRTLQERLTDVGDFLPTHAGAAVAASLGAWHTWAAGSPNVAEARKRLTRARAIFGWPCCLASVTACSCSTPRTTSRPPGEWPASLGS